MISDITIREIKTMRITHDAPMNVNSYFVALKVLSDHDEVPLYLIFSDNAKGEAFVSAINTLFPQQDKEVKSEPQNIRDLNSPGFPRIDLDGR